VGLGCVKTSQAMMVNALLTICVARFMGRSMKRGATP